MAERDPEMDFELDTYMDSEELDEFKNALAATLLEGTDLDMEAIYSLLFHNGRKIRWH